MIWAPWNDSSADVTVVIGTHTQRRWRHFVRALRSALAQTPAPQEVIVVVDHQEALLRRVCKEFPEVTVVANRYSPGAAGTRNTGAEHARTAFVAFLDDNSEARPGWLAHLVKPFAEPGVVGTGGAVEPAWQGPRPRWFPEELGWVVGASYRGMPTASEEVSSVWSQNLAVRRGAFEAVGGFQVGDGADQTRPEADDQPSPEATDLCRRMAATRRGAHWIYVPGAVVDHQVPAECSTFHFFVSRCRQEGRVRVHTDRMSQSGNALDVELSYLDRTRPAAIRGALWEAVRHGASARLFQAGAMAMGFSAARLAGIWERLTRRAPRPVSVQTPRQVAARTPRGTPLLELTAAPERLPGSVRDVEISEPLPAIPVTDERGRRHETVRLIVRVFTEPIGMVKLDLPETGLSPAKVAEAIEREFMSEIIDRTAPAGALLLTRKLPLDGVTTDRIPAYLAQRARVLGALEPVTVVIATRDRTANLGRTLDAVLAQAYPAFEVIVVDNAPTSTATREYVTSRGRIDRRLRYVTEPRRGLAWARNRGLYEAGTDLIAWIDDDGQPDRHWLAEIVRAFREHPEAGAVTGPLVPAILETPAQEWFEQYRAHSNGRGFREAVFSPDTVEQQDALYPLPPFGAGGNMAFRRSAIDAIGGFDTTLGPGTPAMAGEDTFAFTRLLLAGGTIVYRPGILLHLDHQRDLAGLRRQMRGYGVGLTSFYLSLVRHDLRLIVPLRKLFRRGVTDVRYWSQVFVPGFGGDYARSMLAAKRRGMLWGLIAYPVSRWQDRRLRLRGRG